MLLTWSRLCPPLAPADADDRGVMIPVLSGYSAKSSCHCTLLDASTFLNFGRRSPFPGVLGVGLPVPHCPPLILSIIMSPSAQTSGSSSDSLRTS